MKLIDIIILNTLIMNHDLFALSWKDDDGEHIVSVQEAIDKMDDRMDTESHIKLLDEFIRVHDAEIVRLNYVVQAAQRRLFPWSE